jgi:hypothetical protein
VWQVAHWQSEKSMKLDATKRSSGACDRAPLNSSYKKRAGIGELEQEEEECISLLATQ